MLSFCVATIELLPFLSCSVAQLSAIKSKYEKYIQKVNLTFYMHKPKSSIPGLFMKSCPCEKIVE